MGSDTLCCVYSSAVATFSQVLPLFQVREQQTRWVWFGWRGREWRWQLHSLRVSRPRPRKYSSVY